MTSIYYHSVYGSTRQYANVLSSVLGCEAVEFSHSVSHSVHATGPVIVLSPVHGPSIPAVDFVRNHDFGGLPLAIGVVGMTLPHVARKKDQLKSALGEGWESVERFYLPGALRYSQLSKKHRSIMWGVIRAMKSKPVKSDNDRAMIEGYGLDIDYVDPQELDPITTWARHNGA